jgi:hypothetical protein
MTHSETIKERKWSKQLYLAGIIMLLAGLGSALAIYVNTDSDDEDIAGYTIVGKKMYPGMHEKSKKYVHDLEMYGGKAAVLADEFDRWFEDLWHGRTLAYTIAVLSVITSLGLFAVAHYLSGVNVAADMEDDKKT